MLFRSRYLKNGFRGHFSTIGLVGGHEACLNLLGKGIETEAGTRLMIRTLDYLRELTSSFQEETGNLYNLEATPAEGTSYRLAKIDKKLYADIQASGNGVPYYTNSGGCGEIYRFPGAGSPDGLQPGPGRIFGRLSTDV